MNANDGKVKIKDRYRSRLNTIGNDNYFINTYSDSPNAESLVFGDILHFTKNHLQALARTADKDASTVPVQQMKAPEKSEYVHSQMFWMIKGDHVFVIQSQTLKTIDLEQYLDWLLKIKTKKLIGTCDVILDARFDDQAVGGDLGDIQEIVIGGVVPQPNITDKNEKVVEVTESRNIDTSRTTSWAAAKEILGVLMNGESSVASLMSAVPADAELNVQVHIGYKTKKRKVSRAALKQLETGLRNLPDSQIQVKAKGATVAADGMIRLHHNASIRLVKMQDGDNQITGSLLDPTDTLRAMVEAYSTFVANGKIQ